MPADQPAPSYAVPAALVVRLCAELIDTQAVLGQRQTALDQAPSELEATTARIAELEAQTGRTRRTPRSR